jgi:hypothetical protein
VREEEEEEEEDLQEEEEEKDPLKQHVTFSDMNKVLTPERMDALLDLAIKKFSPENRASLRVESTSLIAGGARNESQLWKMMNEGLSVEREGIEGHGYNHSRPSFAEHF